MYKHHGQINHEMVRHNDRELLPLVALHMIFLKTTAVQHMNLFCQAAFDSNLVNFDDMQSMGRMRARVEMETTPVLLLGLLLGAACRYTLYVCNKWGGWAVLLMKHIANLFGVYRIGFVDACFTMNGGASIIYPRMKAEAQTKCLVTAVVKYPCLSRWVGLSLSDWKSALHEMMKLRLDKITLNKCIQHMIK